MLDDLMVDKNTIDVCYIKTFLTGPPGVGKTTTLNRLLYIIDNLCSAGDKGTYQSTPLANCIQVLAFVSDDRADWLSSAGADEETKLLFGLLKATFPLSTNEASSSLTQRSASPSRLTPTEQLHESSNEVLEKSKLSFVTKMRVSFASFVSRRQQPTPTERLHVSTKAGIPPENMEPQPIHHKVKITDFICRLQKLIKSGDYSRMNGVVGNTMLNINDIGGQPGFLEMLPALSTGPAFYLLFIDLSKDFDRLYKIPFSRGDTIITPYDAVHTVKSTISQILSAIASIHSASRVVSPLPKSRFGEKFERLQQIRPLAAIVGTHLDQVDNPESKIQQINDALSKTVQKFSEIVVTPNATASFFPVDNYNGTEQSDIAPIRDFMDSIIKTHFKDASLPIRPKWLLFGTILRLEFKIVKMDDCLLIGKILHMDYKEINHCIRYLDCIGTIMHYTDIVDDDEGWFKNHVICSPQVIFDSISQLVIPTLHALHSESPVLQHERVDLIKKGQFTLESIKKYCLRNQLQEGILPESKLIQLLEHVNLLSPIIHQGPDGERITYLMPAVLECASQEELVKPSPPDSKNPEPLLITFSCGYVPTGTFCGLITRIVSLGPHGIFGLTWKLVEESVKRNCVSFYIAESNKVTLIAHENCYEIRVIHNHQRILLRDLSSHILSVVMYILKSLYKALITQLAFRCPCPDHIHSSSSSVNHLCTLTDDGLWVQFLCEKKPVNLTRHQEIWFGYAVTTGIKVQLEVLKYAALDEFSFSWTKEGSRDQIEKHDKPNVVTFQNTSEEDLGYYRCEVKETVGVVFTVYKALYRENSSCTENSGHFSSDEPSLPIMTNQYLDIELEEKDFYKLGRYFYTTTGLLEELRLTPAEQADVKSMVHREGIQAGIALTLRLWHGVNPSKATFQSLVEILERLRRGDTANEVRKYCVEKYNY